MKLLVIKFLYLFGIAGCGTLSPISDGWRLVWRDEFSQNGNPDPAKWDYEEGFVRNEESQYYTRNRPENARIEDGHLIIEGRKEFFSNPKYDPSGKTWQTQRPNAEYTSASLITQDKASWQYGRLEVRAKVPSGQGAWHAIWMMGINRTQVGWPKCGEVDILEYIGNRDPKTVYGTIHYPIEDGQYKSNGGTIKTSLPPYEGFHVYALGWDEKEIRWFFDKRLFHSFPLNTANEPDGNAFRKPFYLLINLAMGANWPGPVNPEHTPMRFVVDYVRVYQKKTIKPHHH